MYDMRATHAMCVDADALDVDLVRVSGEKTARVAGILSIYIEEGGDAGTAEHGACLTRVKMLMLSSIHVRNVAHNVIRSSVKSVGRLHSSSLKIR